MVEQVPLSDERDRAAAIIQRSVRARFARNRVQRAHTARSDQERDLADDILPQIVACQSIARRYLAARFVSRRRRAVEVVRREQLEEDASYAAFAIQRFFRMSLCIARLRRALAERAAAERAAARDPLPQVVAIQSTIRRFLAVRRAEKARVEAATARYLSLARHAATAAITIQRYTRGWLARRRKRSIPPTFAAFVICQFFRMVVAKRRVGRMREARSSLLATHERSYLEDLSARLIQRAAVGWLGRRRAAQLREERGWDGGAFISRPSTRPATRQMGGVRGDQAAMSEWLAGAEAASQKRSLAAERARTRATVRAKVEGAPSEIVEAVAGRNGSTASAMDGERESFGWLFGREPWVILRRDAAATVQRAWRGHRGRELARARRLEIAAARVTSLIDFYAARIGAWWRGISVRIAERRKRREVAAVRVLQRSLRAYVARREAAEAGRRIRAGWEVQRTIRKTLVLQRWWRGLRRVVALRQQRAAYVRWEGLRLHAVTAQISIASGVRGWLGRRRAKARRVELERQAAMREQAAVRAKVLEHRRALLLEASRSILPASPTITLHERTFDDVGGVGTNLPPVPSDTDLGAITDPVPAPVEEVEEKPAVEADSETAAATKLQSAWRGTLSRREVRAMRANRVVERSRRAEFDRAVQLQAYIRGFLVRRRVRKAREAADGAAAACIQRAWRCHAAREEVALRRLRLIADAASVTIQRQWREHRARKRARAMAARDAETAAALARAVAARRPLCDSSVQVEDEQVASLSVERSPPPHRMGDVDGLGYGALAGSLLKRLGVMGQSVLVDLNEDAEPAGVPSAAEAVKEKGDVVSVGVVEDAAEDSPEGANEEADPPADAVAGDVKPEEEEEDEDEEDPFPLITYTRKVVQLGDAEEEERRIFKGLEMLALRELADVYAAETARVRAEYPYRAPTPPPVRPRQPEAISAAPPRPGSRGAGGVGASGVFGGDGASLLMGGLMSSSRPGSRAGALSTSLPTTLLLLDAEDEEDELTACVGRAMHMYPILARRGLLGARRIERLILSAFAQRRLLADEEVNARRRLEIRCRATVPPRDPHDVLHSLAQGVSAAATALAEEEERAYGGARPHTSGRGGMGDYAAVSASGGGPVTGVGVQHAPSHGYTQWHLPVVTPNVLSDHHARAAAEGGGGGGVAGVSLLAGAQPAMPNDPSRTSRAVPREATISSPTIASLPPVRPPSGGARAAAVSVGGGVPGTSGAEAAQSPHGGASSVRASVNSPASAASIGERQALLMSVESGGGSVSGGGRGASVSSSARGGYAGYLGGPSAAGGGPKPITSLSGSASGGGGGGAGGYAGYAGGAGGGGSVRGYGGYGAGGGVSDGTDGWYKFAAPSGHVPGAVPRGDSRGGGAGAAGRSLPAAGTATSGGGSYRPHPPPDPHATRMLPRAKVVRSGTVGEGKGGGGAAAAGGPAAAAKAV